MGRISESRNANRLGLLRKQRGLSQEELGRRIGRTGMAVNRYESGQRRLKADDMQLIARALDVTVGELLDDAAPSIHLRFTARAFEHDGAPTHLPEPHARIQAPPALAQPEQCFAVAVADDSADRLYPPGSTLIARAVEHLDHLKPGSKVVAARRDAHGQAMEVLVGILQTGATGDLEVSLRSNNRRGAGVLLIRRAAGEGGLADRHARYVPAIDAPILYAPEAADPGEILGVIVMAITPE